MEGQTCTGNCLKCSFQQQVYCSAQRTYGIMKNQEAIVARLEALEAKLSVFNPDRPAIKLIEEAQKDSGADNRESDL